MDTQGLKLNNYLSRDAVAFIKGIAIFLMFTHHFFTLPEMYIDSVSYPYLEGLALRLCLPTRICVGIFTFLNGYLYALKKEKTIKYTVRKVFQMLFIYMLIYAPFFAIANLVSHKGYGAKDFIVMFFDVNNEIVKFGWYVLYYCVLMVVLTAIYKLLDKNIVVAAICGVLPVLVIYILASFYTGAFYEVAIPYFCNWYPTAIMGYICYRYGLLSKADRAIATKIKESRVKVELAVFLMVAGLAARMLSNYIHIGPLNIYIVMDVICVPLFICGLITARNLCSNNIAGKITREIGRVSVYMWLIHSIFFGASKEELQQILYFPKFPLLVFVWGLLICYLLGFVADCVTKKIFIYNS